MARVNVKECEKVGLDPDKVAPLVNRFDRLTKEMGTLGIHVFCGSHSSLRYKDGRDGDLIVAHISSANVDGGAGDISEDSEGFERGEW